MHAEETTDPLEAIDWGTKVNHLGIRVFFAPAGYSLGEWLSGWSRYEKQQASLALEQFSNVTHLRFRQTGSVDKADFVLTIRDLDDSLSGRMTPPGEQLAGVAAFDDDVKFFNIALDRGSSAFKVLLHEFGHGLGLAHPHDEGGTSEILKGVSSERGSFGAGELNQGIYTIMSYNDGWATGPGKEPRPEKGYGGGPDGARHCRASGEVWRQSRLCQRR